MKKFLAILITAMLMPGAVYADVNADKPILVETQDCSAAIEVIKKDFEEYGLADSIARFQSKELKIGTPFAVECGEKEKPECYYLFPIINNGIITGSIDVEEREDHYMYVAAIAHSGLMTGGDESCWNELKDGNAYIIHRDESTGRVFATSGDKNVLLSIDYGDDSPVPAPIDAERSVVDITKPLDIRIKTTISDEETAIWKKAREDGRTVVTADADKLGAINKNDRLLVPLRAVAEIMGCDTEWEPNTKTAVVNGIKKAEFTVNKYFYTVDGEILDTDVPAEIIDGKTYIPLRAVSDTMGADIAYNVETKAITLSF